LQAGETEDDRRDRDEDDSEEILSPASDGTRFFLCEPSDDSRDNRTVSEDPHPSEGDGTQYFRRINLVLDEGIHYPPVRGYNVGGDV